MGFNHQKEKQDESLMPRGSSAVGQRVRLEPEGREFESHLPENSIVAREYKSALKQLGTLGGGTILSKSKRIRRSYLDNDS